MAIKLKKSIPWEHAKQEFENRYQQRSTTNKTSEHIIKQLSCLEECQQIMALETYGTLSFKTKLSNFKKSKDNIQYHLCLYLIFIFICVGSNTFVLPQIKEIYLASGVEPPITLFFQHWAIFVSALTIVALWSALSFWRCNNLHRGFTSSKQNWLDVMLMSKASLKKLDQIKELLLMPLDLKGHTLTKNLFEDDLNPSYELQIEIDNKLESLNADLFDRHNLVHRVFFTVLILCIAALIHGLYAPIFTMGTIVG
ncbi:hypothetical protein JQC92_19335 [Shewanella sp. 202IG2-18]|uniref:hypothetical protein n=1 Tax=Parashewanella hymeniacidonis TaxID=2807618 RepID=UPI001961B9E3|nr:hypothetical protein [Parashewanella hymeniacidonis]MBM7074155.1 hypothetical protein [Parashewanella hymeniacidonis]